MAALEVENGILKDWDLPDELGIELEKILNCLDTVGMKDLSIQMKRIRFPQ